MLYYPFATIVSMCSMVFEVNSAREEVRSKLRVGKIGCTFYCVGLFKTGSVVNLSSRKL